MPTLVGVNYLLPSCNIHPIPQLSEYKNQKWTSSHNVLMCLFIVA